MDYTLFLKTVWSFYEEHGRHDLPWRSDTSMYAITVSELMLQQTQVSRVIPKFIEFTNTFESFEQLANAQQSEVLRLWQGLGYNRRARFLHQAAKHVVDAWQKNIPADQKQLTVLPGVGWNTAGAICAYVFNKPVIYVETNIRAVYLHHFFKNNKDVADKQLLPLIEQTLDKQNSRQFYWALMDYGSYLKKSTTNPSRKSRHHKKQSPYKGSFRQLRAKIIKQLATGAMTKKELESSINDSRLNAALHALQKDNLVYKNQQHYSL